MKPTQRTPRRYIGVIGIIAIRLERKFLFFSFLVIKESFVGNTTEYRKLPFVSLDPEWIAGRHHPKQRLGLLIIKRLVIVRRLKFQRVDCKFLYLFDEPDLCFD